MLKFWEFVKEVILTENKCVLAIVAQSTDSSPGREGFKMAVSRSGKFKGTIGGGAIELKILNTINRFYDDENNFRIKTYSHDTSSTDERSGLICGGSQTIILKKLGENNLEIIEKIIKAYKKGERDLLIITNNDFSISKSIDINRKYFFKSNISDFVYKEIIGRIEVAYIFGAGHVGKEIAKMLNYLGFYIVFIENRDKTFVSDEIVYNEYLFLDFNKASEFIEEGEFSYIIIVSPKHIWDAEALAAVINLDVKYIGVMGSEKKIKTIFDKLIKDGINEKLLTKVHSPIGLNINSETPQEIAISVVSEIIKVKNSKGIR